VPVINLASGIHQVNNKTQFLLKLQESMLDQTGLLPVLTSMNVSMGAGSGGTQVTDGNQQWVVRPHQHSQGRNLEVLTQSQLSTRLAQGSLNGHYARPLIEKKAEYRVYVVNGRVVNVAQKTPGDPSSVAWNVAQGGRFDNLRWGDWPMKVVDLACRVFPHTGLNITGIDIMVDHDDEAWFIEANSAPSLPFNSDGSTTYRQECIAKAIHYTLTVNKDMIDAETNNGWRGYVHPAIWSTTRESEARVQS